MTLDPAVLEVATSTLSDKQLQAWLLETEGHGIRTIAFRLDIAKSTASDRITAAHRALRHAGVRMDPQGNYYLEETA